MDIWSVLILLAFGLIGFGIGFARGLKRTLWRWLTVALSLAASYITTRLLAKTVVVKLAGRIPDFVNSGDLIPVLEELSDSYPTTYRFLVGLISAVAAVPLFVAVCCVLSLIFLIPYIILRFTLCRKKPKMILRLPAGLIGAVGALLVLLIVISPVGCAASLVAEKADTISDFSDPEVIRDAEELIDHCTLVRMSSSPISMKLFEHLTTYRVDDCSSDLHSDFETAVNIIEAVLSMSVEDEPDESFGEDQIEAVDRLVSIASSSDMITGVYAEIVSVSSRRFLDGEAVFGSTLGDIYEKNPGIQTLEPMPTDLLSVMAETTQESAQEDFRLIDGLFAALVRTGLMDGDKVVTASFFEQKENVKTLLIPLLSSPRASALAPSALTLGVSLLSEQIALPETDEEAYQRMIGMARDAIFGSSADRGAALLSVFEKFGLSVGYDAAEYIGNSVAAALDFSEENVRRGMQNAAAELAAGKSVGNVEAGMTAEQIAAVELLLSAEKFGTSAVTREGLFRCIRENAAEVRKNSPADEAEYLSSSISDSLRLGSTMMSGNISSIYSPETLSDFGVTISELKRCDTIPDGLISGIVIGILQSTDLNVSGFDVSEYILLISDALRSDDDGKALDAVIKTVASAYTIAQKLSNGDTLGTAEICDILKYGAGDSIESLAQTLDTRFFVAQGMDSAAAGAVADTIGSFLKIQSGFELPDQTALQSEAQSISVLLDVVQTLAEPTEAVLNSERTAETVVSAMLDSQICTDVIDSLVRDENGLLVHDPLGLGDKISSAEQTQIENVLKQHSANESEKEKCDALRALLFREVR